MSTRQPGEIWRCEACGERLIGALTRGGKTAPVVLAPNDHGNALLHRRRDDDDKFIVCAWVLAGDTLAKARENGVDLRLIHFADCAQADRFRPHD